MRRTIVARVFLCSAILTAAFLGCGTIDGTFPYALWRDYRHPDGLFRFYCLVPPWEEHEDFTSVRPVLVLEPGPASTTVDTFEGPNARIRLEAWYEPTASSADLAEQRRVYWESNGYPVESPAIYWNGVGDEGVVQRAAAGAVWVVELFQQNDGGAAIMSLWGRGSSEDPDLQLLMDSFEPGPSAGSP